MAAIAKKKHIRLSGTKEIDMKYNRKVDLLIVIYGDSKCHPKCPMSVYDGKEKRKNQSGYGALCALFGQNIDREGRHQDCIKLCEGQEPKHTCAEFLKLINVKCPDFELAGMKFANIDSPRKTFCDWKTEFAKWLSALENKPEKDFPPGIGLRYGIPLEKK